MQNIQRESTVYRGVTRRERERPRKKRCSIISPVCGRHYACMRRIRINKKLLLRVLDTVIIHSYTELLIPMMNITSVLILITIASISAFSSIPARSFRSVSVLRMADVEVIFPNNKKVKVATGSSLKDAAKKAGFTPNYGN